MKEFSLDYRPGHVPSAVAAVPFFKNLAPKLIDEILENTTILDCDPRDVILEEGADGQFLLFLLKGRVRIQKEGSIIAAASGGGQLLGEIALLKKGQRSATIIAEDQVYCLKVDPGFLEDLTLQELSSFYAALYRFLAELLAQRLEATSDKLAKAEKRLEALR